MPHYEQAFYIMAETVSYFYYFAMARSAWAEYITHTENFSISLKVLLHGISGHAARQMMTHCDTARYKTLCERASFRLRLMPGYNAFGHKYKPFRYYLQTIQILSMSHTDITHDLYGYYSKVIRISSMIYTDIIHESS